MMARLVYSRYSRTSRRLSLVSTGISRVLIPKTGTMPLKSYWLVFGVYALFFHHAQNPAPWFAADGLFSLLFFSSSIIAR